MAMLSRAADQLYWMARYMERAENMARILDVSYRMSLSSTDGDSEHMQWGPALVVAVCEGPFKGTRRPTHRRHVGAYFSLDSPPPSSVPNRLGAARENSPRARP
ncbi:MAG: alpha-E domain-containing protein, partial [Alphaproteobacteria bacterium]|nr:alpha-E domain-containing protein [Alphaproteobacteria bacterium]